MALEMKVFKEVAEYEPKPMWGMSWRQIAAFAFMTITGGGTFALVTWLSVEAGANLSDATTTAMYAMFPILLPAAFYGWWRPKGLKPEVFVGFLARDLLKRRSVRYADTYDHTDHTESVPSRGGRARKDRQKVQERPPKRPRR